MALDQALYRHDIRVSTEPLVKLSVIDIAPEHHQHIIVFIHGFGGEAKQWVYQLDQFSDNNRVIAIDLRGHGRSAKPKGDYSMHRILSDLEAALDVLGVNQKFTLVGHSFGGAIAAEFAAAHQERVERLILIATSGEFKLNPLYRFLLNLPHAILRMVTRPTRNWLGAPPPILKSWYEDNLSSWNGWSLYSDLYIPTLVIRGHHDRVFSKPLFEEVTRVIPNAEEVDVGASGHMVMLERRDAVNRAINRFMDSGSRLTWRESEKSLNDKDNKALLLSRPWLPHYDEGVPQTIAIPRVPLHHLLNSSIRRFPNHPALSFEGTHLTYKQLGQEVNRFANMLLGLGLKKGDRVMVLLPNLPQMVIAYFGTLKAGGVAVFTLPTTKSGELLRQVHDCGAHILVTLTQSKEMIQQIKIELELDGRSPLKHIILTDASDYLSAFKRLALKIKGERHKSDLAGISLGAHVYSFRESLRSQSRNDPEIDISTQNLAVIIYTGGTTDAPKGVMLSHHNLIANAIQTRHWMSNVQEGRERFLCVLPFTHSYGMTTALNVPIAIGATLIIKAKFEVMDVLNTIKHYHPTIFPGVPQMYVAINNFPGVRKYGIESINACISGSDPLPIEVQEAFEKLTRGRLVEGYGLTEASPVTHGNPLYGMRKVGSIGVPFPSTEARVVDLRSYQKEMPTGQIGELAVRGPQIMMGYWKDEDATAQALSRDGWLFTGDVAQMDSDGYFRIIARKADMWYPDKAKEPAFPRDVEEVLFEVPQIKEVAVVAIAGQPIAFVIAKKDRPSTDSLIAYCQRRLPPELVPRLIIFLEDFPRTFIGKVLRRELARKYQERQSHKAG